MKNIVIQNKKVFENLKKEIAQEGASNFLVAADFDRTFTYGWIGDSATGKRAPSLVSILRDEPGYLSPDYAKKAQALADKYHPVELDLNISKTEKKKAMEDWWQKAFELLIQSDLDRQDIAKAVMSENLQIRKGALDFLRTLERKNIPLVFVSATGIGVESIKVFLEKRAFWPNNVFIVSNDFEWSKQGKATGWKKPVVHTLNKGEIDLKQFSFYDKIKNRPNILLLGDSVDDVDMAESFQYKNLLKIGFLDFDIPERLPHYQAVFDVVLLNNSSFDFPLKLTELV